MFLVRCGETEVEAFDRGNNNDEVGIPTTTPQPEEGENDAVLEVHDSDDDESDNKSSSGSKKEETTKEPEKDADEPSHSNHDPSTAEVVTSVEGTEEHNGTTKQDEASEHSNCSVATPNTANNDSSSTTTTTPRIRLCQRVDPFLTLQGFQQAQTTLTQLMLGLSNSTEEERRMAAITAPTKACTGTGLMLTCAGLNHYTNLRWQLATVPSLQAPCAVPIVVHNILCAAEPEIEKCGGHVPVVDAGLLHCAAAPWNDARQKCPFSHVLKHYKGTTKEFVRTWKEENNSRQQKEQQQLQEQQQQQQQQEQQTAAQNNRCIDVQYLRVADTADPWSLEDLTMKNNILVDLIDPKRYMTPPRKGQLHKKRVGRIEQPGPEQGVRQAVLWSRQVGCDAVILFVGKAAMQELAKTAGLLESEDELVAPACSLASLVADVPDKAEEEEIVSAQLLSDIDFEFYGFFTSEELQHDPSVAIPPYTGPVDTIVPPPEGKDPMTVPVNQWSKFPPPEPENIPDDYPDLPPFSKCLEVPLPKRQRPIKQQQLPAENGTKTSASPQANAPLIPEQAPSTPNPAAE